MTLSVSALTGGPADVQIDDSSFSHTMGGTSITVSPQHRMRTVDKYGQTPIDVILQGEDVRVTAPFAEWKLETLQNVYSPGSDSLSSNSGEEVLGIGRSAGFIFSKHDLKVIPFLTDDAGKKAQFYQAVQVGDIELSHNNEDDRVWNTEWVCLADPDDNSGESPSDGGLIGQIFI